MTLQMTILLPALAVAFAAFCVWLTVRVVNRRERWAKRTLAVTLSLPLLYVLSFGPACWLFSSTVPLDSLVASVMSSVTGRTYSGCAHAPDIYWPLGWAVDHMGEIP